MEKKGDILNQLAIISDLIEKTNLNTKSATIVLEVSQMNFNLIYDEIVKKYGMVSEKPKDTFTITIGAVDIVFNTNNV